MRLMALRGATTVDENESAAILDATEELMRTLLERNSLSPSDLVSCLFTCTEDLNAEFPAVAARNMGLSGVPLLCAREIDVPGSLPRVIRLMVHCYSIAEPQHVYLRDAAAPPGGPRGRAVSLEFAAKLRAIPVYPAAETYAFGGDLVKLASNEAPWGPHPKVLEAVESAARNLNRYPDPSTAALRTRIAERTDLPAGPRGQRQRQLRDPAGRRRRAARARRRDRLRLARRSRCIRCWPRSTAHEPSRCR